MLKNLSIMMRISLGFALVLIVTMLIIVPMVLQHLERIIQDAERTELQALTERVRSSINTEGRVAEALSTLVASSPEVQQAMADGNRGRLTELLHTPFLKMEKEFAVRQFQLHTPPATSMLRLHKLPKFGDDLSSFRHTVVEANQGKKRIRGIEKGVAGLGVRGIAPIAQGTNHLGTVEFGMSFGQPFFELFKKQNGVDVALHIRKDGAFTSFASTFKQSSFLTEEDLSRVQQGEPVIARLESNGVPLAVIGDTITDYSDKPIGVIEIAMDRSRYADALSEARLNILLIGGAALLFGFFMAVLIARSIVQPLNEVVASMKAVAEGHGDLTQRLPETGRNELASLGREFNQFINKLENVIVEVAGSVVTLSSSAEHLSNVTERTSIGIREQHKETSGVAAAISKMNETIREVADNASTAAKAAQDATSTAENGQHIIVETIKAIHDLVNEVDTASKVINKLESDSENIGSILEVIRSIADQTNLLALNAAIEAARAGEQGRGFAVVADEVRTLAHRTQSSTEEIQKMIEDLQSESRNAVVAIEAGLNQTQGTIDSATRAGESLHAIAQAINTISNLNRMIATSTEHHSEVSIDIAKSINNISSIADDTADQANETEHTSGNLATQVSRLQGLVMQFQIGHSHQRLDLSAAKAAHLNWKARLRSFLDGETTMTMDQAVSHHHCDFGKWYYGEGLERYAHIHQLAEVEAPHAELHRLIKTIIQQKHDDKCDEAERSYAQIAPLSKKIVGLLDQVESIAQQQTKR